ncbi:DUF6331 family protein [Pseudovibrio sp. WM33]|uniref:DUF6331 family protein n=1 Tax=Pseudovibrio sp. WM33 TaxID=1735585 RepID=UPI0007B1B42A|nr:DUF6331 family protein [Pseudovibrio sp. WM33]KZL19997.1 hypothetical protein PsWM33_04564 [Pseudovibrio sp. WM33]
MEDHLISLPRYCANMCEIECCGLDACDFSPIHIASYCQSRSIRYPLRILTEIINQAETLKANYGSSGASGRGITLAEINERMSGQRVDIFADMLLHQAAKAKSILNGDRTDKREPVLVWAKA